MSLADFAFEVGGNRIDRIKNEDEWKVRVQDKFESRVRERNCSYVALFLRDCTNLVVVAMPRRDLWYKKLFDNLELLKPRKFYLS